MTGAMNDGDHAKFKTLLEVDCRQFFQKRIALYERVLRQPDQRALKQVMSLVLHLNKKYKDSYDGTFTTQIREGEAAILAEWTPYCNALLRRVAVTSPARVMQQQKRLEDSFEHAYVLKESHYDPFCHKLADAVGGKYEEAPFKGAFRALEKTMMQHNAADRRSTAHVVDILRGTVSCKTLAGALRCLQLIVEDKSFRICRVKDRFSPGCETSAHWRDVMLNGYFVGAPGGQHIVEIQIHHETLGTIRKKMGGHFIYAQVRSLIEALEVTFGAAQARSMLTHFDRTGEVLTGVPEGAEACDGGGGGLSLIHI